MGVFRRRARPAIDAKAEMDAKSNSDPLPAGGPARGVGRGAGDRLIPTACVFAAALVLVTTCNLVASPNTGGREGASPISILLVGDLMLGRGVAPIAAADPSGLFEEVRPIVEAADLSLANLESPLTVEAHRSAGPYTLEADPSLASVVERAGFDLMVLANNHTGDAGPSGVRDTIAAVNGAGMGAAGAGSDLEAATRAALLEAKGLTVAVLSFDATGSGMQAGVSPGVASWQPEAARLAVAEAAGQSDLVVVSVHGGVEYLPDPDPRMTAIAEQLASWGVDIVWGHGAHVVQPVGLLAGEGARRAVVATSLGNFLFDQHGPLTGGGAVLEVLADGEGVIAYRLGATTHYDLRVHFQGWNPPSGDAALIDSEWWNLVRAPAPIKEQTPHLADQSNFGFEWGSVVAASTGRITGSGASETVISFRHDPGPHPVRDGLPDFDWVDASGMSAHLGIYRSEDLQPIWVAGMVPAPISKVAACDGSVALAYTTLDSSEVLATGAAVWRPFGLDGVPRLDGPGTPMCADVDGDMKSEPVILGRS